jgi:ABC-2 type transport system permease protein
MDILWLIISREYLTRVRKRTFILTTILTPLFFVGLGITTALITTSGSETMVVVIKDDNGLIKNKPADADGLFFEIDSVHNFEELKDNYKSYGKSGVIHLPKQEVKERSFFEIEYFANDKLGKGALNLIGNRLEEMLTDIRYDLNGYSKNKIESLQTKVSIHQTNTDSGKSQDIDIATAVGAVMGLLIYLVIFIYGSMVMRSVMEEKNNRVIEVIISSVKPFQLMFGKIVGVALVGLTQFAIWIITVPILMFISGIFFHKHLTANMPEVPQQQVNPDDIKAMSYHFSEFLHSGIGWLIILFLLFFIGGYLLYASLFAAVGSAVGDDAAENQSLTIPITIPVILSFYIGMAVINNPNSTLATWASQFPLFSPIVMTTRLAFHPPVWQIISSLVLLYATCFLMIWLSGRIYRTGILSYGKKVTLRQLVRWIFSNS